ncbi:hypothetical protein [Paracraurococcus lichenis]|uniref:PepSY domain-containing protein n=1 Tax=Paracraurococcus lichenis TaxID=3064888 RepID=A0ABT9E8C0_9PROT|nr:hypothetical protein [Paracraurococcus sp. LOR1-02]MDO9712364.1 hypothetical protein [Paracraurococcus sp. LOR1-02]
MRSTTSGMVVATLAAACLAIPTASAQQQGPVTRESNVQKVQPSPEAKERLGQEIALSEVPPKVMQTAQRELKVAVTRAEKMMVYTQPVYELTGQDATGQELKVKVNDDGTVMPSGTERR